MALVREIGIAVGIVIITLWLQSAGLAALIHWVRHALASNAHRLGPLRSAVLVVRLTAAAILLHANCAPKLPRSRNIDTLRRRLHNPLPRGGVAAEQVVSALAVDVIDGLHSTASGRFFAWVIGGALLAALDADWLTAAWDQNAYNYVTGPAAAVVEECEPQTACGH